uniref:CARD domain-containing protein n=1 Tax=Sphaeramia orbicularis TaxID=375764 RepID=A0A673AUG1_9TELE
MSAIAILRRKKRRIQWILSADPHLFIQKLLQEHVITHHEHRNLKQNKTSRVLVIRVLNLIVTKGETMCRRFLELLRTDEDLKAAFPGLQEKLRDYVDPETQDERHKMNLLSVLEKLKDEEFKEFKRRLKEKPMFRWSWLEKAERTDVVNEMTDSYGESGSLMKTRGILEDMNRSGLVWRLTEIYSEPGGEGGPKTQTPEESKKMNLLSVLEELKDEDFKLFKRRLYEDPTFRWSRLEKTERTDVVDLMMDVYGGSRSRITTRAVLDHMNRTDLVQRLTEIYSQPGGEGGPKTQTPEKVIYRSTRKTKIQRPVVTLEAFSRSVAFRQASSIHHSMLPYLSHLPSKSRSTNMERILQDFLDSLTQDQFDEFKQHLKDRDVFMRESNLETASRRKTVKIMFQMCGASRAMEETRRVLNKMGRTDLVQRLSKLCSTLEGPSAADLPTPSQTSSFWSRQYTPIRFYPHSSTQGPSTSIGFTQGWFTSDPFTPGPSTSNPSASDPSPSESSIPSPSKLDPSIPGPCTSDPSIPGLTTSDLSIPGPSTSDLSIPGTCTSHPSIPGLTTSDMSTPSPTPSDMSTLGPSTSDRNLRVCEDVTEDCVDEDDEMNPHGTEKQQLVCTEAQAGPSDWEEFTPEDSAESGTTMYRFRCPRSGSFHCTRTGLVFVVHKEAGLQYRTVQWDEDLLESASRTPAGPLFSIECPDNAVRQLHFPHCEDRTW